MCCEPVDGTGPIGLATPGLGKSVSSGRSGVSATVAPAPVVRGHRLLDQKWFELFLPAAGLNSLDCSPGSMDSEVVLGDAVDEGDLDKQSVCMPKWSGVARLDC